VLEDAEEPSPLVLVRVLPFLLLPTLKIYEYKFNFPTTVPVCQFLSS
jgi:hypothetical protein